MLATSLLEVGQAQIPGPQASAGWRMQALRDLLRCCGENLGSISCSEASRARAAIIKSEAAQATRPDDLHKLLSFSQRSSVADQDAVTIVCVHLSANRLAQSALFTALRNSATVSASCGAAQ
jgi:hypothetical protein